MDQYSSNYIDIWKKVLVRKEDIVVAVDVCIL